ncbi:hypothetical protein [Pseudotabrizicola algicola]|uniref:Uncharacterized protein n=1 Tax=Pseudotabrizicola algicola TaxID=2709381 RepID=A0A6B3RS28_9RHOB|nr:hypothetical protein [Pseudotabrizicola algicola]NEX47946.1 hypothetical protein [Pseudotabrizicola algicola]
MNTSLTIAAFALSLFAPLWMALASPPRGGGPLLVVLPPWADADRVITQAGGQRIGPVAAPFAVLAQSDHPLFVVRLMQSGVWAVRDGRQIAQICGARA